MKRNIWWVGLVALVLCVSVAFLTGCAKKAGLKSEETITQEQKPAAKAPAAAPAPAPPAPARDRTAPDQSLQDKSAADKAAADKAAKDKAAADKAAKDKAAKDKAAAEALLESLKIPDIRFDFDKYNLTNAAALVLKLKAPAYVKNKDYKLVVEGHCDERGTVEYNLALGQKRADEAAKYLIDLGVEKDRIKTISYGEEMPLAKDHTEEAWAINRRAHFVLFPPAAKK
jgi:peptidoglycan-associated lipoprotein